MVIPVCGENMSLISLVCMVHEGQSDVAGHFFCLMCEDKMLSQFTFYILRTILKLKIYRIKLSGTLAVICVLVPHWFSFLLLNLLDAQFLASEKGKQ